MDEIRRVPRPGSELESPANLPPRGVNRSNLSLYLAIGAAVLSVASAGVGIFRWQGGEQDLVKANTTKANTENSKIEFDRETSKAEAKFAGPIKDQELSRLQNENANLKQQNALIKQQIATERTLQYKNMEEAQVAEQIKESERVRKRINKEIVEPMIPMLQRSALCGMTGDPEICGFKLSGPSIVPMPVPTAQRKPDN